MGHRGRATSCFVIPTRDRPGDLLNTIRCLANQTVLPAEVCIVDSSDNPESRTEAESILTEAGVRLHYLHPSPRGAAKQRNLGIEITTGDPVFLIDDDVWIAPDCHEQILREYEQRGPELGGVCPCSPEHERFSWLVHTYHRLFDLMFGLGGWWPDAPTKVTAAFFVGGPTVSTRVRELDCFKGHFMSFRREVFSKERFDEAMPGYAWKGDFDFTYRVSRHYTLVMTPGAFCRHLRSGANRLSSLDFNRMKVADQIYLHRKLMPQTLRHRCALWWALIGLFLYHVPVSIIKGDPGYALGIATGLSEQVFGKGLIDPAGEA